MYLCYIDESGTSQVPGNTSHFILAGLSIPIWHWNDSDRGLRRIRERYDLVDAELHTAWMLRHYIEQSKIPDFAKLGRVNCRSQVESLRTAELLRVTTHSQQQAVQADKKELQAYQRLYSLDAG